MTFSCQNKKVLLLFYLFFIYFFIIKIIFLIFLLGIYFTFHLHLGFQKSHQFTGYAHDFYSRWGFPYLYVGILVGTEIVSKCFGSPLKRHGGGKCFQNLLFPQCQVIETRLHVFLVKHKLFLEVLGLLMQTTQRHAQVMKLLNNN